METIYRRVLIKISGEALAGEKKTGFDFAFVTRVCETVKRAAESGVTTAASPMPWSAKRKG